MEFSVERNSKLFQKIHLFMDFLLRKYFKENAAWEAAISGRYGTWTFIMYRLQSSQSRPFVFTGADWLFSQEWK